MSARIIFTRSILLLLLVLASPGAFAQDQGVFTLTSESLEQSKVVPLADLPWKYHKGDDPNWAVPEFDDSSWASIAPSSLTSEMPPPGGWNGIGWFRLRVRVDKTMTGMPWSLAIVQFGASEIYLDGRLLQSFGRVSPNESDEETFNPSNVPVGLAFATPGEHLLAIRYSNSRIVPYAGTRNLIAFRMNLGSLNSAIDSSLARTAVETARNYTLISLSFVFCLLHLFLFALYPKQRANLYYSLFLLAVFFVGVIGELDNHAGFQTFPLYQLMVRVAVEAMFIFFILYLYTALEDRLPRYLIAIAVLGLVFVVQPLARVLFGVPISYKIDVWSSIPVLALQIAITLFVIGRAIKRRVDGAPILGVAGFFFASIFVTIIVNYFLPVRSASLDLFYAAEFVGLMFANTFFLARQSARTNRDLEIQLAQVKELSERTLQHQRAEAELRVQHEREKAENERRARELEEARQLQLSMLPESVPQLGNIEIAAYMKPATEVGGDYYDFHVGGDDTLTIAVGDATGHGLKAGSVVTAAKSLFTAFAGEPDILRILERSNRALKGMKLRGMFMAFALAKVKDSSMTISLAGMPPVLIYRSADDLVEELAINGMPLGSISNFPYRLNEVTLSPGDIVVLMSDGFAERFNRDNEMLSYERAREVLAEVADRSPREIIDRFVEIGDKWARGRPQDDDITFVVLKMKNGGAGS